MNSPSLLNQLGTSLLLSVAVVLVFLTVDGDSESALLRRGLQEISLMDEGGELPPLFPLQIPDYIGFSLAISGLMLAAGGGIGGGGILVPIYILVLEFPVKHAIPLASVTVFGGAIANNLLNVRKKHPDHPHRSCIDWELILQMEPATMAGALVGAELNDILPDLVIIVLLLALLSFTAHKTLTKAHSLHGKETAALLAQAESQGLIADGVGTDLARNDSPYGSVEVALEGTGRSPESGDESSDNASVDLLELEVQRESMISAVKLVGLFIVVTMVNLLKGGPHMGGGPFGLPHCGSSCFWMSEFFLLGTIVAFGVYVRTNILSRISTGKVISSDIHWDKQNTVTYPIMAIVAGLAAGMFGIGGGIVKGPLMLALGVAPAVASATSACMILFTSCTAAVSYSVLGLLKYDYAAFCLVVGFVSTIAGQTLMTALMEKYKRHSYIAYVIGIVVAISAVAMTLESILATLHH